LQQWPALCWNFRSGPLSRANRCISASLAGKQKPAAVSFQGFGEPAAGDQGAGVGFMASANLNGALM
jgi:hypothetical protein